MTSPSADRPLLLPEEIKSFTEDDVRLMWAARMEHAFDGEDVCICGFRPVTMVDWDQHFYRAGLKALAAAGRLLPASVEHREGPVAPYVFVQWKGTDVCLDFHCVCGGHAHVDASFVYRLRCSGCDRTFELPHNVPVVEVEADEYAVNAFIEVEESADHEH